MCEQFPIVSVILPVYNGEKFLSDAIESILNQTYQNYEFIIINDGSSDSTEKIILSYKDERIKYILNETNLKLTKTLNIGLMQANGKYIVRMDADDMSRRNRLEIQVKFMEEFTEIGVCSSFSNVFGSKKVSGVVTRPLNDLEIKSALFVSNPIEHPGVIIRKSVLIKNNITYNEKYYRMEDLGLWVDLMPFTQFANIPKILLDYRYLENSESRIGANDIENHLKVRHLIVSNYLGKLGIFFNHEQLNILSKITSTIHVSKMPLAQLKEGSQLLFEVVNNVAEYNSYFTQMVINHLLKSSFKRSHLIISLINMYGLIEVYKCILNIFRSYIYKRKLNVEY